MKSITALRWIGHKILSDQAKNFLARIGLSFDPDPNIFAKKFVNYFEINSGGEEFRSYMIEGEEKYRSIETQLETTLGEEYYEQFQGGPGDTPRAQALLLYSIIRHIEPDIVVETGVAQGVSSSIILSALAENGSGELYSVDLPKFADESQYKYKHGDFPIEGFESAVIPVGKEPGWLVDENHKSNWTLKLGRSSEELLPLISQVESIDFFIHDSEHSYENILFELKTVEPKLAADSWVLVDDVHWNDAFEDFVGQNRYNGTIVGRAGIAHRNDDLTD